MKKHKKPLLNMDERNKMIALRIIAVMYFLTIIAIQAVVIYRQFALKQEIDEFEDLAIIMTVNSIFLISALLYFGAIPLQKIKIRIILIFYLIILVLGSLFTYAKYNIFQKADLSISELADKMMIVAAITGIMVLFFALLSYLGNRKMEQELSKD